jgi:hypothetical protein
MTNTSPWPLPLLFTSWGFRNGGVCWSNAAGLRSLCIEHGIRTVAVQTGKLPNRPDVDQTTRADVDKLREGGQLRVVVWGIENPDAARRELERLGVPSDDWMPQIEGPGQADLVYAQANAGLKVRGIVTNYASAGDGSGQAGRLHALGVRGVFVECYTDAGPQPGSPHYDVERMLNQGVIYGWPREALVCTFGAYRGETPAAYKGAGGIGRQFGVYLAEPMARDQWEAFGKFNPAPPPPTPPPTEGGKMEPITPFESRASIVFAARAWESTLPEAAPPTSRLTVCRRIAQEANRDAVWNTIHRDVVALLDKAKLPK